MGTGSYGVQFLKLSLEFFQTKPGSCDVLPEPAGFLGCVGHTVKINEKLK
jgi:hypothetical protein